MRAIRPRTRPRGREEVVTIDTDSAPRIMFYGENFLLEDLPVGTRVIYPKRPLAGVPNPVAAIRYALNHPEDMEPLHALLEPGMKVTIAMDDISLPLPIMRRPDVREMILNIVCEMLADHGVDDVHIIVATSLHRRMHDHEIRRAVGEKVWREYWPDRLYNHDACDPDGMVVLGKTRHGELVEMNRRAAESDLVIYVNINLVPMDGGHKSVGVGLCGYESLKAHHTPKAIVDSNSFMDPKSSALADSVTRIGRVCDQHVKVFHIETALNNRAFGGQLGFLMKNEDDFTETDRLKFQAIKWTLDRMPYAARRELFMRTPSPYEIIACHAGATDPVHEKILTKSYEQYAIEVQGQADILITGIPFISPYNVNSKALNPLLVQVLALGYFYHMYRNKPLLRDGGVLIIAHPCSDKFDPVHHPSYIEFFNRLLPETTDSYTLETKYQDEFAYNPSYVEMYRRGNAYHGAHPFYMWYWGQRGREKVGRVIVVGSDNATVPALMGWERAGSLAEAIAMGRSTMGRSAQITMLHHPPILMTDVV
ncbi:lactate racemase domain-containing protein [Haliangium sp.]|uniref:lactate racemase domain-containing protein n=1 Tax=Haliangium sp. TaxID=2663208 RepID=UPI003D0E2A7F